MPAIWPTTLDLSTGAVRVRVGDEVDAMVVRAGVGAEIRHQLVQWMLDAPVIVAPRPRSRPDDWILLAQPRTPMCAAAIEDLAFLGVSFPRPDSTILLPAHGSTTGHRWLEPPDPDRVPPPWGAVVGAARRTCSRTW
ncbi:hypothetical protein [Actinosynnema sp. NPDC020468]|uniref:hypothetical protein n=1 Tax=Actinosynnema sp. NPDC020468 TaxID=3154488 RepID=UPI0033DA8B8F